MARTGHAVAVGAPPHRRPGLTLYRYFASEALLPTLFTLAGLTTVVLTQDLLGLTDLVVNRGLGAGTVSLIAFYKAVPTAALIAPFAVLIGCLVVLGRMGADLELVALESTGVSVSRLIGPVTAFAGLMTVGALGLSIAAAPWSNRSLDATLMLLSAEQPWSQIRQGSVTRFGEWQLEARQVNARGDRLEGVLLWMPDVGQTVFARKGMVEPSDDGRIEMELTEGSVVLSSQKGPRMVAFDRMTTLLPDAKTMVREARDRIPGLPLAELAAQVQDFVPGEGLQLPRAAVELQRRFAMPVATLVFGALALPLLLVRDRFSRAGGGVMGLLCTISYYGLVHLGEGLAQAGLLGVAAAVWFPNAVLAAVAAALFVRVVRRGGLGHTAGGGARGPRPREDVAPRTQRHRRYPLPRYVAGRFIRMAALSFAVLLVAYLIIDIMERVEWFSRYQATGIEILRFYSARVVLLASRVVAPALVVATALTVSLLAVEGELVGMRACGIPAPRALLPVLFIAMLIVPAYAAFTNVLVPRTNALADELKETEIKAESYRRINEHRKAAVWHRDGDQILEAARFDPDLGFASELSLYELGPDRLPVARTDARAAIHVGGGKWKLIEPTRIEISDGQMREVPAPHYADLGEKLPDKPDTMHMSFVRLGELIEQTEADHVDALPLRVDYHVKLAEPLACIVLPALVLFFASGGPPFPGPAQTLLASAVVAIGYILLTGVSRSLGYSGAIPAAIGGWGPAMVFTSASALFGLRLWRRL